MEKRNILHISARAVFIGASAGILLAFLELGVNFMGTSLIGNAYAPGRILELSATLLIYVLTVLVWEVLAELKSRKS
jgi:hypothetical protein